MTEKTIKILNELHRRWDEARSLQNKAAASRKVYESTLEAANGLFSWNNTSMVMLLDLVDGGCYEEHGSIIGLAKDGRLMWEFQSHCSCNKFSENTSGFTGELPDNPITTKSLEIDRMPEDWEEKIQASALKLLDALKV